MLTGCVNAVMMVNNKSIVEETLIPILNDSQSILASGMNAYVNDKTTIDAVVGFYRSCLWALDLSMEKFFIPMI